MITNNFLMSVPQVNVKKEAINYSKTNGGDKKEAFEKILNQKKDVAKCKPSNGLNNSRARSISQQNQNIKENQNKSNSINDKEKDNNSLQGNRKKDVSVNKTKSEENTTLNLEETNEKIDVNSTNDHLISLLLGTANSEKIQELEDAKTESTETQLINESFVNIIEGSALEEGVVLQHNNEGLTNSTETVELFELTDLHEQNNEIEIDLNQKINEANPIVEEGSIFFEDIEVKGETINEEIKTDSLFPKIYENEAAQDLEQTTDTQVKASNDEKIVTLKNGNEGKDFVNDDELKLTDDANTQNSTEIRDQNFFTQFNENSYNFDGKNFENNLDIPLYEKNISLNKEDIFEQIVEKVKIDLNNTDEIRIKLKPAFLGEISLKLTTEKGVITAKAYVDNHNVKQLIESNLDTLKENMKGLGLNFEALDVSVGKDSGFDKNNGQAWKQSQRVKTKKLSVEKIMGSSTYEEDIKQIVGGLYSAEGNIDLIV